MAGADYVVVGSGINALVAAALLGRKGHKVLLLERNDRIGGCIRTEEITAPGFLHDVMATTFVLFLTSPAYAELGPELEKRGLGFAHTPTPTAVLLPDGRHAILAMDRKANVAQLRQARGWRRRALCRRHRSRRRRRSVPVRAARRLVMVARDAHDRGAPSLAPRLSRAGKFLRRSAGHRARLARKPLSVRSRARAVRALGAAYRSRTGKRLFGPDGEGHCLCARSRRRADRQGRRQERAGGVRAPDPRPGRRHSSGRRCRAGAGRCKWRRLRRSPRRRQRDRGRQGRYLFGDAQSALRAAPRRRRAAGGCHRGRRAVPLRQGQYADPLCAQGAAAVESAGAGGGRADPSHAGTGRRFQSRQRSGARHAAGAADHLRRPAGGARSERAVRRAPRFCGCNCPRRRGP